MPLLALTPEAFVSALDEVRRLGAARVQGALTADAQRRLLAEVEAAPFQPAPRRQGEVSQDYDVAAVRLTDGGDSPLPLVLALAGEYAELARAQAEHTGLPWLAGFRPGDVHVQRYRAGAAGISAHRDGARFVRLVSVFSLGAPAELILHEERQGPPLRTIPLAAGDLVLLRAPGFEADADGRPMHSVAGPREGVRYSISLRMRRQARGTSDA